MRDTRILRRHPPPRPRLRQRRPTQFAGTLTPPAFPREYPYSSARLPHPARACGGGIPLRFSSTPHPARAFGAPPPPPPGGGVRAWRYQVSSRTRGGAGGQPCQVLRRLIPGYWTVWISPRGERLTGRGNLFPLPCLPHSNHLTSRRHPLPAPPAGSPTPPAPAALLPRPREGAGSVRGDIRRAAVSGMEPVGNRIRLFSRFSPCCGPWGYRHGGRG